MITSFRYKPCDPRVETPSSGLSLLSDKSALAPRLARRRADLSSAACCDIGLSAVGAGAAGAGAGAGDLVLPPIMIVLLRFQGL